MKRILLIFALLAASLSAMAQNYKPLEPVELSDSFAHQIRVNKNSYMSGDIYYTASHYLTMRSISADINPVSFNLHIKEKDISIPVRTMAVLAIGGESYTKMVDFVSENDNSIYIDIVGEHVKHIAVSGLQSITFKREGEVIATMNFSKVEQELWRRTAEELIKEIKIYHIL